MPEGITTNVQFEGRYKPTRHKYESVFPFANAKPIPFAKRAQAVFATPASNNNSLKCHPERNFSSSRYTSKNKALAPTPGKFFQNGNSRKSANNL